MCLDFYIIVRRSSVIYTAIQLDAATITRLLLLRANIIAAISPMAPLIMWLVEYSMDGKIMADRQAQGMYFRNERMYLLVILPRNIVSGKALIRYVVIAITAMYAYIMILPPHLEQEI